MAIWFQGMFHDCAFSKPRQPQVDILVDRDRAVTPVVGRHERQTLLRMAVAKRTLGIVRFHTLALGFDPDLQQMYGLDRGIIELAMLDAGAGADALHVARLKDRLVAHA